MFARRTTNLSGLPAELWATLKYALDRKIATSARPPKNCSQRRGLVTVHSLTNRIPLAYESYFGAQKSRKRVKAQFESLHLCGE